MSRLACSIRYASAAERLFQSKCECSGDDRGLANATIWMGLSAPPWSFLIRSRLSPTIWGLPFRRDPAFHAYFIIKSLSEKPCQPCQTVHRIAEQCTCTSSSSQAAHCQASHGPALLSSSASTQAAHCQAAPSHAAH